MGVPAGPGDQSLRWNWRNRAWGWASKCGKSNEKWMYSPRRILSSEVWSKGQWRPSKEAMPVEPTGGRVELQHGGKTWLYLGRCILNGCLDGLLDYAKLAITEWRICSLLWNSYSRSSRVVKSSWLLTKITTYLVSISWLLCLAFLYGWHFLHKISLAWLLTLITQSSTSKLSDNPRAAGVFSLERSFRGRDPLSKDESWSSIKPLQLDCEWLSEKSD